MFLKASHPHLSGLGKSKVDDNYDGNNIFTEVIHNFKTQNIHNFKAGNKDTETLHVITLIPYFQGQWERFSVWWWQHWHWGWFTYYSATLLCLKLSQLCLSCPCMSWGRSTPSGHHLSQSCNTNQYVMVYYFITLIFFFFSLLYVFILLPSLIMYILLTYVCVCWWVSCLMFESFFDGSKNGQ